MRRVVIPVTCWPSAIAGNIGVATSVIAAGLSEAAQLIEAPTIVPRSGIRRTVAAPAAALNPIVSAPAAARIRIEEFTVKFLTGAAVNDRVRKCRLERSGAGCSGIGPLIFLSAATVIDRIPPAPLPYDGCLTRG
jgi:hypothetical protein